MAPGTPGFVQELSRGGGAEVFPILKHPDEFLVRGDFEDLNDIGAVFGLGAAGGTEDDGVAVGEAVGGLMLCRTMSGGRSACLNSQDALGIWGSLHGPGLRVRRDERVAVVQADGRPTARRFRQVQMGLKFLSYSTTLFIIRKGAR